MCLIFAYVCQVDCTLTIGRSLKHCQLLYNQSLLSTKYNKFSMPLPCTVHSAQIGHILEPLLLLLQQLFLLFCIQLQNSLFWEFWFPGMGLKGCSKENKCAQRSQQTLLHQLKHVPFLLAHTLIVTDSFFLKGACHFYCQKSCRNTRVFNETDSYIIVGKALLLGLFFRNFCFLQLFCFFNWRVVMKAFSMSPNDKMMERERKRIVYFQASLMVIRVDWLDQWNTLCCMCFV